jgi:hypothetical protein
MVEMVNLVDDQVELNIYDNVVQVRLKDLWLQIKIRKSNLFFKKINKLTNC